MKNTKFIDFTDVINEIAKECKDRGLKMKDVIKHAGVAKSTPETWKRKNPKQFDNLAAIYKSMNELQLLNEKIEKLKKSISHE